MSKYVVRIVKNRRPMRQRFHVRIEHGGNYRVLFTSETLTSLSYARTRAAETASDLGDAVVVDDTLV